MSPCTVTRRTRDSNVSDHDPCKPEKKAEKTNRGVRTREAVVGRVLQEYNASDECELEEKR